MGNLNTIADKRFAENIETNTLWDNKNVLAQFIGIDDEWLIENIIDGNQWSFVMLGWIKFRDLEFDTNAEIGYACNLIHAKKYHQLS